MDSSSSKKPCAVVLGGTGHIGSAIARSLDVAGYNVTATGRRAVTRPSLEDTGVSIVSGDDSQAGQIEEWVAGADVVVDAATPYPIWMYDGGRSNDPVVKAIARADRLIQALMREGAAFVHISSFVTTPHSRNGLFGQVQDGLMRGLHPYFDLKQQTEERVLAALRSGLRGSVIAPTTVFGPYDSKPADQTFIPMLLTGQVRGLVRHDLNVIDVRDLADLVAAVIEADFPRPKLSAIGHNTCVTDLARNICLLGGKRAPLASLPAPFGVAGMVWMETAFAAFGQKPPAPSLPMMLVSASYSASPDHVQKGLLPQLRPLTDTLSDAIAWYRQTGYC